MLLNKKSKIRGSGILVVILSSIAFSIYAMSAYLEVEHFSILLDKYEKNSKEIYEKYIDNVDDFYNLYYNNIIENNDIMYK
jgi:hypothetical protein